MKALLAKAVRATAVALDRLVGLCLQQQWTEELPTIEGYYIKGDWTLKVVRVRRHADDGELWMTQCGRDYAMRVDDAVGWWIGPLPISYSRLHLPRIDPQGFEMLAAEEMKSAREPGVSMRLPLASRCSLGAPYRRVAPRRPRQSDLHSSCLANATREPAARRAKDCERGSRFRRALTRLARRAGWAGSFYFS
jgi:hypothetical protein